MAFNFKKSSENKWSLINNYLKKLFVVAVVLFLSITYVRGAYVMYNHERYTSVNMVILDKNITENPVKHGSRSDFYVTVKSPMGVEVLNLEPTSYFLHKVGDTITIEKYNPLPMHPLTMFYVWVMNIVLFIVFVVFAVALIVAWFRGKKLTDAFGD